MAKRKLEEINAGSMADIAFLLLIFFLVTTTMDVDAGISRNLPLKPREDNPLPPPEFRDRDILVIMANSKDELLVEGEYATIEDLEEKVRDFYTANMSGNNMTPNMPFYNFVDGATCQTQLNNWKAQMDAAPDNQKSSYETEVKKWEKKMNTFKVIGKGYYEISPSSLIQLKNQSGTSYGLYIQIQDVLKKVVNELRQQRCDDFGWDYEAIKKGETDEDKERFGVLEVLVPERIVEAKIEQ